MRLRGCDLSCGLENLERTRSVGCGFGEDREDAG
jgi:hypothetical protein